MAAVHAEAERVAAELAEAERVAAEWAAAERLATEQAEAARLATEYAEWLAAEQAQTERLAEEQAIAKSRAATHTHLERSAAKQIEAEWSAVEQTKVEGCAVEQVELDGVVAQEADLAHRTEGTADDRPTVERAIVAYEAMIAPEVDDITEQAQAPIERLAVETLEAEQFTAKQSEIERLVPEERLSMDSHAETQRLTVEAAADVRLKVEQAERVAAATESARVAARLASLARLKLASGHSGTRLEPEPEPEPELEPELEPEPGDRRTSAWASAFAAAFTVDSDDEIEPPAPTQNPETARELWEVSEDFGRNDGQETGGSEQQEQQEQQLPEDVDDGTGVGFPKATWRVGHYESDDDYDDDRDIDDAVHAPFAPNAQGHASNPPTPTTSSDPWIYAARSPSSISRSGYNEEADESESEGTTGGGASRRATAPVWLIATRGGSVLAVVWLLLRYLWRIRRGRMLVGSG
jgi:hypothetical protein